MDAYLVCYSAAEAARRSGYSPKRADSAGWRVLQRQDVRDAVQERLQEHRATADDVLHVLSRQMHASLEDCVTLRPDGSWSIDVQRIDERRAWPLVRKLRRTMRRVEGAGEAEPLVEDRIEIELHDPQKAAELLARHHKLLDRGEESVASGRLPMVVLNVFNAVRLDPGALQGFVQRAALAAIRGEGPLTREEDR